MRAALPAVSFRRGSYLEPIDCEEGSENTPKEQ